jgi:hypothetical protein
VTIEDEYFVGHHVVFVNDRYPAAVSASGALQGRGDWKLVETKVLTRGVAPGTVVAGNPARELRRLSHPGRTRAR